MRKNDLIKKLQAISGNPEVVLWNGMVGDWMPVGKLQESYLTRVTKNYYIRSCEMEEQLNRKDFNYTLPEDEKQRLEGMYKKVISWEDNQFVTEEDVKAKRHQVKRVLYIDAKKRGVSTFDRLGSIEY